MAMNAFEHPSGAPPAEYLLTNGIGGFVGKLASGTLDADLLTLANGTNIAGRG